MPGLGRSKSPYSSNVSAVAFSNRPDIVLLATEWRPRVLLRAQLIEEGFEVLATDTWTTMRGCLRPGSQPLLAIVDLQGLPHADQVLSDLKALMKPTRVLVLAAIGTLVPHQIQALGFRVVRRPIPVGRVVAAAAAAIREENGRAHDRECR